VDRLAEITTKLDAILSREGFNVTAPVHAVLSLRNT